ncbi:hypothetical protein [Dyadobacter psychrophilus]|uniref:Uncharacterized protein n=1 Tax=Dyadobacter psychrophilus TaxID=651661 RepID=A0A1T5EQD8_9BACT|nr:hypothetical protein [Dyadobacter psychrophilus]SKB86212.1 hypothetical protein SAMN05660293_02688 [Dyadobacter psychrophilus]
METKNQNDPTPVKDEAVKKALASGRNANDNFQQNTEDDYGIDQSAPDADQQLEEREASYYRMISCGPRPFSILEV